MQNASQKFLNSLFHIKLLKQTSLYTIWVSCDKAIPNILRNWGTDATDISTPSQSCVASAFAWIQAADVSDNVSTSPASFFVLLLGLSWDHSNKWIISFDQTTFIVALAECSGFLSCWKVNLRPGFGFFAVSARFLLSSVSPSTQISFPLPVEQKQPHSMITPLPSFTVDTVL